MVQSVNKFKAVNLCMHVANSRLSELCMWDPRVKKYYYREAVVLLKVLKQQLNEISTVPWVPVKEVVRLH